MNDFTFMKKMNEEDAYLFKRCIRKMLSFVYEEDSLIKPYDACNKSI